MTSIKTCKRCLMDNSSDNQIVFDRDGYCNYCNYALIRKDKEYFPNDEGILKLEQLIKDIKIEGKDKNYDCIMGLSGGLDSSYLAYLGSKHGLRILGVHIDDGFNTNTAEDNLAKLCESTGINMIVETPDLEQFNDVTKSLFLAGVSGICNPQDNIIFSNLYRNAIEQNIRVFLSGQNFHSECILQRGGGHNAGDGKNIEAISKQFGNLGHDKLKFMSLVENYLLTRYKYKIKKFAPLNYISYNNRKAFEELNLFCGFEYYGGKHRENILTHFAQDVYLPEKFNIDKRKSHLSSLILSGELSREEAISILNRPILDNISREFLIDSFISKLGLSRQKYDQVMSEPPKSHTMYPHSYLVNLAPLARKFRKFLMD